MKLGFVKRFRWMSIPEPFSHHWWPFSSLQGGSLWSSTKGSLTIIYTTTWGEIDCTTRSIPGRPGGSDFSLIGDWGCPRIARHFLARAEQSGGPFAAWLMFFLVCPVTWMGHPRFPRLNNNQVGPWTWLPTIARSGWKACVC